LRDTFIAFHKTLTQHNIASPEAILATDANTQKLASNIVDRCEMLDECLKRAADIVSQPAEDPGSSAKSLAEALVQELAGTTTIGFGVPDTQDGVVPSSGAGLEDTSGLAAMLGGGGASSSAAPAAINTLQPRKKGVKRAALEPATGQEGAKKPAA
jgi:hypothetical protein